VIRSRPLDEARKVLRPSLLRARFVCGSAFGAEGGIVARPIDHHLPRCLATTRTSALILASARVFQDRIDSLSAPGYRINSTQ
jgi:hypothetical protein